MELKREKIKSIKKINSSSLKYDLSIKDNHNFFANNIFVHNCTTIYRDGSHARSLDSKNHVSRDWIKSLQSRIAFDIPDGWRLCGENLFARHSISYTNLDGYFYLFSIWDDSNNCLSWDDTTMWAGMLGIPVVPVIYRGQWDEKKIQALYSPMFSDNEMEGYVVRLTSSFSYEDFGSSVAKFVRKGHVQTSDHWMNSQIEKNGLIAR